MPRRRSRDFFIVEQHFFDSDPRYDSLELADQQRYMRLWARSKRTRHEVIPNVDTITPGGRRALTRLLRTSTRSLDACVSRLTAPGAPDDPLVSVTKRGYIRVYGCSKVHGVDRNSVHYVDPDLDSDVDSHSDSEEDVDSDVEGAVDAPRPMPPEPSPATDHVELKDPTTTAGTAPPGGTFTGPIQRAPEHVFQGMKKAAQSLKGTAAPEATEPMKDDDPKPYDPYPWIPHREGARGPEFHEPSNYSEKGMKIMDALRAAGRLEEPAKVTGPVPEAVKPKE